MEDRGPVVLAVTTAMIVASSIFILLRIISRVGFFHRFTLDDWIIILAWAIAFGFSFSICYGTSVGLGHHENHVLAEWRERLKKSYYAFSVLYNPALMATKTSILVFYLSLSEGQHAVFRWATIATLVVVNGAGLALTLLNIFQCRPVGAVFQDPTPSTANCTNIVTLYLSSAPVNIITDLAVLVLPMPVLTGMRLPSRQKIILIITFSFGAFVTVVDVVRIAYLQQASINRLRDVGSNGTGSGGTEGSDFSWYASLSFMWSAVEVNIGIMCACIPSLKPLASHLMPSMLHRDNSTATGEEPGSSKSTAQHLEMASTQKSHTNLNCDNITSQNEPDGGVDTITFATLPWDVEKPPTTRTRPSTVLITRTTRKGSLAFFDFVNMNKHKCLVKLSHKESILPIAIVTVLFFVWGFAYALLDALNGHFEQVVKMDHGKKLALHGAYFAGYLIGPLTFGRIVLEKWGFKASFIVGLLIYSCGTLLFWPSAVLTSFTAFLISNLIVGTGLSSLEIAANPFVALCGPPDYGEFRLNMSQAFQGIGGVLSPLLAQKVLFKGPSSSAPSLINSQWAYLGISLFDVLLALAIYYSPLPEATNEELEEMEEERGASFNNSQRVLGIPVAHLTLTLGVFSQFCSVSAHKSLDAEFASYVPLVKPHAHLSSFNYHELGFMCFSVGRFLSAFACLFTKPRYILLFEYLAIIVLGILAMNLKGYAGISMPVVAYLFQGGLFPFIFAMSLRGLGRNLKLGSTFLTASVSGGAILPVIMDPIIKSRGLQYSFCVMVAMWAAGAVFPLYCNMVPAARKQIDPHVLWQNKARSFNPR